MKGNIATNLPNEANHQLLEVLKHRFEKNMHRHRSVEWASVLQNLLRQPQQILCLQKMEETGGEPDVTGVDDVTGKYIFIDCSKETPAGRRSLCYDNAAMDARKENKPVGSAMQMAADMGIAILDEGMYRQLQSLESFDCKTSSWLFTPNDIRKHGGAIFGDYRYEHVFIYHNGAQSYYAARGFRGMLLV